MKINAKLLVIAMIISMIFSVSAVAASCENITELSSDFTQVPHEQVVSVSEPTVQEVGATNLETSADNIEDLSSSDNQVSKDSTIEESDNIKESNDSILGKANDEDILNTTYTVNGNTFTDIQTSLSQSTNGDVINLDGKTYIRGSYSNFNVNKKISIIGGLNGNRAVLDGQNIDSKCNVFKKVTFINVDFINFKSVDVDVDCFQFYNVTLINCTFDNCLGDRHIARFISDWNNPSVTALMYNCNFTNSHVLYDGRDEDDGQMVHLYGNVLVDHCNFINTSSKHHAGALCMDPVGAKVTNSYFENCSAWIGGAIYVHGHMNKTIIDSVLENCTFINCEASEDGGAIATNYGGLNITNCRFYNNTAQKGGAIMVGGIDYPDALRGDNLHGHNIKISDCDFYDNVANEGGAIHISGDNDTIVNCHFDDNFAVHGKGAAIYVEGENASVYDSTFKNHESEMGTVYIEGNKATVVGSQFDSNHAHHGGAGIYVEGNDSYVYDCKFRNNNASMHGGAIHTIGSNARILNSEFKYNNAIPSDAGTEYGLGGAIYIDGNNNEISFSTFSHNTARNGSAVYNRGDDLHLNDDTFTNNQAWSYLLFTEAKPPEAYWSEDLEFMINVTLEGGDNLINAIYNDWHKPTPHGVVDEIFFHNVTYTLKPNDLYPTGIKTTTDDEVHPVLGVQNSHNGAYLYQDSREDDQLININITYGGNKVFEFTGKTDMYGNVLIGIKKENLTEGEFHPGIYNVSAHHPDDSQYTAIDNSTIFRVLPHVDVSVTKTSNKDVYIKGENAIFTIKVYSVGTNATNVTVKDILPESFRYVDSSATRNNYNPITNEWYIGFLPHGASETLTLTVQTTELGTFDNVVIVNSTERDWNLSNNRDNKTIHVNLYYTKEANVTKTSVGEYIEYYLRVYNTGSEDYTEIIKVHDVLPQGIKYANEYTLIGADLVKYVGHPDEQVWTITNISAGTYAQITVKALAVEDGLWNNSMRVEDYPSVNATVNVTSVADLQIIKSVSKSFVSKDDVVNWTITVINHGPSIVFGVYVKDLIPEGLVIDGHAIPSDNTRYDRLNGIWTIGTLGVEEYVTLIIPTRVTVSDVHNITNVAVVNATTPDSNETNNVDNDTIYLNPDVTIDKTVSSRNSHHGQIISWNITVTNNGPNDALNVYVIDKLPGGLRFINSTKPADYNPVTGRWNIQTLKDGESVTLTINTEVIIYDGFISNNATVYASNDHDLDNNYDDDYTQVRTEADVGVIKIVSNKTSHYGDTVIWTIVVTNYGPNIAEDVILTDYLPNGLIIQGTPAHSEGHVYVDSQGRGIWNIGNLAVNQTVTCEIITIVNVTDATITNTVSVNATTYDPNLSNNIAENKTYIPPESDVEVIKSASNSTPNKYDEVIWTITIYNDGPNVAENVILTDVLPNGLEFVTNSVPTIGMYHKNLNEWDIGTLEVGVRHYLTITTRVVDTGRITNEVNITTSTYDRNLRNNYDNETINVPAIADLEIVKTVSDKNPKYGDLITWTITVTNKGPNNARDVYVIDKLPHGLIYVNDSTGGEKYNPISGRWDIGDLLHFDHVSLVITTRVNIANATITNIAVVDSSTPDNDTSNNKANNTTHVDDAFADLEVIKLVSSKTSQKGDTVIWTIIVTNHGPDTAKNVIVRDKLPGGLIYRYHTVEHGLYDPVMGIWLLGDLAKDDTYKLIITTIVGINNGTITNVAVVNSTSPDNNTDNNKANNTTEVGANADLEVIKIVSNKNPHKGDTITWTIIVTNHGPSDAKNVRVIDKLPNGLIFNGANGDYNSDTGVWNVGDLANGASKSLIITTIVNITNSTIRNVANVTSDTPDYNETNNNGNNTTHVDPEADLEIVKLVSTKNTHKGDVITWTIIVTNKGPDTALNVYVKDKLPQGLVFKSYSKSKGLFDSNDLIWYITSLAKGESATLTISTLVNVSDTTLVNNVNVTNDVYDPNETNNKANNTTEVGKELPADLEVVKVVSNKNPHKGDTITWTITVTNHGPGNAYDVTVTDRLPEGLKFVSSNGNYNKDTGVWTIGELSKGESKSLIITTLVTITNAKITNVAVVNSTTPDNNTDNNKDNDTADVDPEADVKVIKTVSNPKPSKGDTITWTIVVFNLGPDAAKNVLVSEILPEGLKLLSAKGSKGEYEDGIWTIGTMENGEIATLTLTTKVLISHGTIENIVVVNSTTYDPNMTNNKDIELTNPQNPQDDDDDEDYNPGDSDDGQGSEPDNKIYPNPNKNSNPPSGHKMHATGNPFILVLLALLAIAGVSLRRRN